MRNLVRFSSIFLLFSAVACQYQEEEQPQSIPESGFFRFNAVVAETETRTSISTDNLVDGTYRILWEDNDMVSVFSDGDKDSYTFVLEDGAGSETASFVGPHLGNTYHIIYPASIVNSRNTDAISVTLPSEQRYSPSSIGSGYYPMYGYGEGEMAAFKNLCSVFRIRLKGFINVFSIEVRANNDNVKLSGNASVSLLDKNAPVLSMSENAESKVTLKVGGKFLDPESYTDFNVVIPSQDYKGGFTVVINTDIGPVTRSVTNDLIFKRSEIRSSSLTITKTDSGLEYSTVLDGLGTEENPLIIKDVSDLLLMRAAVNTPDGVIKTISETDVDAATAWYRLDDEIDLSSFVSKTRISWIPIGDYASNDLLHFDGVFDGNGNRITGLYIDDTSCNRGLFGGVGGVVKNLEVDGHICGGQYSGSIAGNLLYYGEIYCCRSSAEMIGGYCGGIVGYMNLHSIVNECTFSGALLNSDYSGGIAAVCSFGIILNSQNVGRISGWKIGGICGAFTGWMLNCVNSGMISGAMASGIVNTIEDAYRLQDDYYGPNDTHIINCINTFCRPSDYKGWWTNKTGWWYDISDDARETNRHSDFSNCYWVVDYGQDNITEAFGTNYPLSAAQMSGAENTEFVLYTTSDNVPCRDILSALNNWAYDHRQFRNYYQTLDFKGWEIKDGEQYPSLKDASAVPGGGDMSDYLVVTPSGLYAASESTSAEIKVKYGSDYSISYMPSWIRILSKETYSETSNKVDVIILGIDENNSGANRDDNIVFIKANGQEVPFPVTQKAKEDIDKIWKEKPFYHRSLGMAFTATWCAYCQKMAVQWESAQKTRPNKIEIAEFHPSSSKLGTDEGEIMCGIYNVNSFPKGVMDSRCTPYYSDAVLNELDNQEALFPPVAGISFNTNVEGDQLVADISMYVKQDGDYKVTALLLEDGIVKAQSSPDGDINDYVHDNVVRMAMTDVDGDSYHVDANTVQNIRLIKDIPAVCNRSNLRLLVYVQKKDASGLNGWIVDNCRSGQIGKKIELQLADEQSDEGFYCSSDYSQDGKVTNIQNASEGRYPIDIVITGDAFADKDQSLLDQYARKAMEAFFEVEPYRSMRQRFSVHVLNAVSLNNAVAEKAKTKFSVEYGSGTRVLGDNETVLNFVTAKMPSVDLTKSIVIVLVNDHKYAGTAHLYSDNRAVVYVPLQTSDSEFERTLRHEAAGHGFGKLADEYGGNGAASSSAVSSLRGWTSLCPRFYENVDATPIASEVKWAWFLNDSRYSAVTGIHEGGYTYDSGIWRPTANSIMRYNTGSFNSPSRLSIYRKIMQFSEGDDWTLDMDAFVEFDEVGLAEEAVSRTMSTKSMSVDENDFVPLAPPVLIMK